MGAIEQGYKGGKQKRANRLKRGGYEGKRLEKHAYLHQQHQLQCYAVGYDVSNDYHY